MKKRLGVTVIASATLFLVLAGLIAKRHPVQSIVILNNNTRTDVGARVESRSGNNRADEGSLRTGNATSGNTVVETFVNTTVVDCCGTPKPTEKPSGNPTPTPTQGAQRPTATPTPSSGGGGNGGGGGNNGGGGTGGADVGGAAKEQGQILGLAATSGMPFNDVVIQGIGLICAGVGLILRKHRVRA